MDWFDVFEKYGNDPEHISNNSYSKQDIRDG